MARILEATCDASGKVYVNGHHVKDVQVMTDGAQDSEGILILDGTIAKYITVPVSDLATTIEKTATALGEIATALTTIDVKPVGGTGSAPAPAVTGQVTNIQAAKAELESLKGALK